MMRCEHCVAALDSYVDDELLPDERRDIEEHLAACAGCARERDSITRVHATLSEGLVRYQAPDVLKARIRGALLQVEPVTQPAPTPRAYSRWRLAAAAVLIAAASSAITLGVVRSSAMVNANATDRQVLASHLRSLQPGHLTDVVSTNQHNVKPWFNGRVDLSPPVPDLAAKQFELVGGRVDYVAGRAVAVVIYRRRLHVISAYSWPSDGDTPPSATTRSGFHLVHWRHDGLEHWVVSDLNPAELNDFVADYRTF
jgi:anti-sigma factor RsiW